MWLSELESAYNEVVEYKLPEIQGLHTHYTLTTAIVNINSSFSHDWDRQLLRFIEEDSRKPKFRDMVQELRELICLRVSRQPLLARCRVFAISFQGVNSNSNPVTKLPCLCDGTHLFANCDYLIPEC